MSRSYRLGLKKTSGIMRDWRLPAESPDNWQLLQTITGYETPGQVACRVWTCGSPFEAGGLHISTVPCRNSVEFLRLSKLNSNNTGIFPLRSQGAVRIREVVFVIRGFARKIRGYGVPFRAVLPDTGIERQETSVIAQQSSTCCCGLLNAGDLNRLCNRIISLRKCP